jgi:hypothetical protein
MIPGLFAGDRMRRFVEGADRGQSTLFPECLEDWIGEDNPVRVIDVFVDEAALTWTAGVAAWRQCSRHRPCLPAIPHSTSKTS